MKFTDLINEEEFFTLRNQLALQAENRITDSQMSFERQRDHSLNPYNDYHKPSRRGDAEIRSDLAFNYADQFLQRQYGKKYTSWLSSIQS